MLGGRHRKGGDGENNKRGYISKPVKMRYICLSGG
jgi:hypothetical protein